jgi:gliding motility-associated-like protein
VAVLLSQVINYKMNMKTNTNTMASIWKKIVAPCVLACTVMSSHAQKEAYNWVMGSNVAMTWNTTQTIGALSGLPTPISTSATFSGNEGVLTVSDAAGNLLFYSDGINIWDATHTKMNTTALTGNTSSAQSGIVIPYPGQANKYIVFSIGESGSNILAYTIVDMTLNSGWGSIPAGQQNIPLTGASGVLNESVSAVKHANGTDYWIVAPGKGAGALSAMNVWKVTSTGVQTLCIGSYQLPGNTTPHSGWNGCLRFSPSGKYFAWAEGSSGWVFFGNFDPSTGVCSNIKMYNGDTNEYGVEFSPDGKVLYVAKYSNYTIRVYKFDELLAATTPNLVTYKTETITGTGASNLGTLQTGPDGRIYGALSGTNKLLVISNPNDYDNHICTVVSGLVNADVVLGLPNFLAEYFHGSETEIYYCKGATATQLQASSPNGLPLHWYEGSNKLDKAPVPNTSIAGEQIFYVAQINEIMDIEGEKTKITVTVIDDPKIDFIGNIDGVCYGNYASIKLENIIENYIYNIYSDIDLTNKLASITGESSKTVTSDDILETDKTYYISVTDNNGCSAQDTTIIDIAVKKLFIMPESLPLFRQNVEYDQNLTTNAGLPEFRLVEGELPYGLTLSSTGRIYGVPGEEHNNFNFTVEVTDSDECSVARDYTITNDVFVPKAFTPNNDGINDFFMKGFKIIIFDRMGIPVFEGDDGWDGTYKGKIVARDIYFYKLFYSENDATKIKTGYVGLIKN